jgi:uncharacterized protein (TIGR00725 family)
VSAGPYVAVVGPGDASAVQQQAAETVGELLARSGAVLVCGGLGGVMAAACRGAASANGLTVGLLPGRERTAANEWVRVAIPTGMGEMRNGLVVRAADAVLAIGGAYGTLSEISLALKTGVPVIGLDSWAIDGVEAAPSPEDAAARAHEIARARLAGRRESSVGARP